ncbi:MAG: hypothetical protein COV45_04875 [Deltaproteobacteria bacterium CG11_big_fil_rev_8_21_14_0_20_47_16]|nr:MAG: hypothetical protein COV45_04875 [Deltaproteobacteria bacterium CG11_big_fil_rev_8_21_14_0_20_47_16]
MTTKRAVITVAVAMALLITNAALAADTTYGPKGKRFGVGIYAGEPTGFTLKGYIFEHASIDAVAAWSFVDGGFTFMGDFLYDFVHIPVQTDKITLPFYAGAGGRFAIAHRGKNDGRNVGGVRIPVGIAVHFTTHPIEIFFEAGPGIDIAPSTSFDMTGGVGARFYF